MATINNRFEQVVWATSQEHPLMKRLYSLTDISAVKAVARLLARRCLKAGTRNIYNATFFATLVYIPEMENYIEDFYMILGLHQLAVVESAEVQKSSQRLTIFLDVLSSAGIALEEPEVVLPPQRLGVNYDVVNPDLYIDEEAQSRVFPQSKEEYDPEIDLSFDDEGLTRKHQNPQKSWEDYRPLVDPEPKDYGAALKSLAAPAAAEEKEEFVRKGAEIEAVIEPEVKQLE